MRAATHTRYGSPDVLTVTDVADPAVGDREVLVAVHASPVTQGDRRLRAADYPSISWLPGRLMSGLVRPRHPVPGSNFAGRVVAVGPQVTRFAVGDDVFGTSMHGAHAELIAVPEDSALARMPANLDYEEAAAVPYGGGTALYFLRDLAKVRAGERVLVLGASGGVGRFAVQLARHLGAEVTGVCHRGKELVRELGATHVIDYREEDFTRRGERYDVILDTSDATSFGRVKGSLTPTGRYLTLFLSLRILAQMALTRLTGGPRALLGVALGGHEQLDAVRELVEAGALRPVLGPRFPLERAAEAHAALEARAQVGTVVITTAHAAPPAAAAPAAVAGAA